MIDDKVIRVQINEYCNQLQDLKAKEVNLLDNFVTELLIKKLPKSWMDCKQQLKHKHKQMSLSDLITYTIIEDIIRKDIIAAKERYLASMANVMQHKPKQNPKRCGQRHPNHNNKNKNYPRVANPTFKKKGFCFVCGKQGHHAPQCRKLLREMSTLLSPNLTQLRVNEMILLLQLFLKKTW